MTSAALSVLVLGATGRTGSSIINGLVGSKKFNVIAAVRPASLQKPVVLEMQSNKVEIRQLDLESMKRDSLVSETLKGVDVVISAIEFTQLDKQPLLVDAAKEAGVKRFIPCDWGTACVKGRRKLFDDKLKHREYVKASGIGYTFIDVGWWFQNIYDMGDASDMFPEVKEWLRQIYGDGNIKTAVTDVSDVGRFTARIIDDPRTLNQYVFCWGDEVTGNEIQNFTQNKFQYKHVTPETVKEKIDELEAKGSFLALYWEYVLSMWVAGDNTIENAKKPEYGSALDARELYPDFNPKSFAEFASEYFKRD